MDKRKLLEKIAQYALKISQEADSNRSCTEIGLVAAALIISYPEELKELAKKNLEANESKEPPGMKDRIAG